MKKVNYPNNTENIIEFNVEILENELRLDKYLSLHLPEYSRSYFKSLIDNGNVLINGSKVKNSFKLTPGIKITIKFPNITKEEILPENIPLDILYEDDDIILVNKPKGMVVHPSKGHYSGTLANGLLYHCKGHLSNIDETRPGIVHRIDKDTTGVIVACKNNESHLFLAKELENHSINRIYKAIVCGILKNDGVVNAPIGRNKIDRKKRAIAEDGRRAVTHYKVLENFSFANSCYSYIECRLETGRTHQIRVHMSSIGHPLLGDTLYGSLKCPFNLSGQVLHAEVLGFIHPETYKYMEFSAPLPEYFTKLLSLLKKN